jgi:DNA polymerase-3 subunit gamma/tau
MSYQVLARKWRPANFSQVAGQAHVLKSLINALDNERLHHAYLFTGTRGVGKTTLARILAKCLNCDGGITSTPCEQCASCTEINEGRFIDLIEVDAASRTKVEDTRELLENVQYTPTRGRFKVYLIDEVHMLSNHSFNALLKTLEEPPPHVKFLFATTDPQKLPVTILSRCLQFNLKNLSPKTIVDYLQNVLREEGIDFDDDALWQIAAGAAGSMRDALTLVDQAISYCQGSVNKAGVVEMLGVPENHQVYQLLHAMSAGDIAAVLSLVNNLSDRVPDYAHTLDSLLSTMHRLAIAQVAPGSIDNSYGDKEEIAKLAQQFSGEDIQLFYQIGVKGRADLRSGVDVRSAFEMLLIRMMVFSPNIVDEELKPRLEEGPAHEEEVEKKDNEDAPVKKKTEPGTTENQQHDDEAVSQQPAAARTEQVQADSPDTAAAPGDGEQSVAENPGLELSRPELNSLSHQQWLQLFSQLKVSGIAANVLANLALDRVDGDRIHFRLDESQSAVYNEDLIPKLCQPLAEYFGQDIEIEILVGDVQAETPAQLAARVKQEFKDELVQQFESDGNVQQLVERFSAKVEKESILPIKNSG